MLGCWDLVHSQVENNNPTKLQVTMKSSRNAQRHTVKQTNILNLTPYCRERARAFSRSRPVANIYLKTGSATSQISPKLISLYWTRERRGSHRSSVVSSKSVKAKPQTLLAGHLSVPISHVHFVLIRWEKSSAFFQHQCHRNVNIQQKIHSRNRITSPLKKQN